MMRKRWRILGLCAVIALGMAVRAAAVSVSPVALYIDDRTRTGTLTLFNPGTRPEEITVEFAFGYPVSDDSGNVSVPLSAEAPAGEPSAVPWLRAFPRRMVLEPGQRQVVRVVAQPPAGLSQGEYWSRVLVRSRGGQPPIEQRDGDVAVKLDVETVVVVALSYRNGDVVTGLRLVSASAKRADGSVTALVDVERQGNAAFIGRILSELVDAEGRVVAESDEVLAVYRSIRRRVDLTVPDGVTGPLRIRFRFDTERDDLPPGAALPVAPLTHEVAVQ